MYFEIIGEISEIEIIAKGNGVRRRYLLNERYGNGRWRKLKGVTTVRLNNGRIRQAEIHWYEAHGIGRRLFKIKRYLE
ncbi:hypothetical protein MNBD_CHLOROFLEXI01-3872 [hydrothermal vent metagenome]|uniref:Uncharacterized protein n=1 Tax=hydrothermal vent metagenome TaxID=652676 RepID=A0A3B0V872_9ZZZZ